MKDYLATIIENKEIANGICSITFRLPEAPNVRCGQFGDIDVGGTHLLRVKTAEAARAMQLAAVDGIVEIASLKNNAGAVLLLR